MITIFSKIFGVGFGSASGSRQVQSNPSDCVTPFGLIMSFFPVFLIRIRTDPHKDMPPASGSAWTDADPDPGG